MLKSNTFRSKLFISAAIVMAVILTVSALSFYNYAPVQAASEDQSTKRTINVGGQGTVNVSPDIAYVTLGVITENNDAKLAQQSNAASMDKVIALIKASGVKSDDIKTVGYNINPKYDYNKDTGNSKIVGYTVSNTVQVTVRDITKTGSIIDLAAGSGVNLSNSINFGLSDYEKYYNEALKKAVDVAKKRAETMAGTFGITLKMPVSVTESGGYGPVYNYGAYDMGGLKSSIAAVSTPVQAGTVEIRANVNMVYEY